MRESYQVTKLIWLNDISIPDKNGLNTTCTGSNKKKKNSNSKNEYKINMFDEDDKDT